MRIFADRIGTKRLFALCRETGFVLLIFLGAPHRAWALDIDTMLDPPRLQSASQGFSIVLPPASPIAPPESVGYSSNNFDNLEPTCHFRDGAMESEAAASGFCGSVGKIRFVPREVLFGDQAIDIETQCLWHEQCYLSGRASAAKEDCDNSFRAKLEDQCRNVVAVCGNVLRECLNIVDSYAEVVQAYGDFDGVTTGTAPDDQPVQAKADRPAAPAETGSGGGEWVYVGEYNGAWVSRNFDVQDMISGGVSMTAINYVNIRGDHMRKNPDSENWENADKIGVITPGETVAVSEVMNLGRTGSPEHIWAKIAR
jgi:hypothetical protein